MADCPRCSEPLVKLNACQCGWKKRERAESKREEKPRIFVDCAYEGCKLDAVIRHMTPTGWAVVCPHHYEIYHGAKAKQYTAGLGLKTRQDLIQFCREKRDQIGRGQMHGAFKKQFEAHPPVRVQLLNRVPGEDDEPVTAEAA